jgi:uncharacterized cupin superfamily protein
LCPDCTRAGARGNDRRIEANRRRYAEHRCALRRGHNGRRFPRGRIAGGATISGIKLIKPEARKFEAIEGVGGDIRIGRDVGSDISKSLSAGIATFENCAMEWTVKYDEYFYCLEGTLTIETKEGDFVLTPGTGLWLPEGTWLVYKAGARARVVFSVYPANWRERLEKKA